MCLKKTDSIKREMKHDWFIEMVKLEKKQQNTMFNLN